VREKLRDHLLTLVDEAELMTTDSHVVNTVTGKNPVGLHVPAVELVIHVEEGVKEALADLSPAEVAGSTACCERVVVFGSNRIAQLASTMNAILIFIPPLSAAFLILAFLLSIAAYVVLV
jgi:putative membrane protein